MKTTIRNHAAALGIAAVASLAGIGLASGPALAAPAPAEGTSTAADAAPQSVHFPTDTGIYADELVRAWGADNADRVEAFASPQVVEALNEHGNEDATHWVRTGGDGAAGTIYSTYENTVTGETMSVGVSNDEVSNGGEWGAPHGVHKVQFGS
ncbi:MULTISPECIES: hypothetical protein [Brevibacterium]|uniref:Peptidase propeptide and YPEB domain-containing protein n=1 Tax=Brevibacterium antiquum CNRZ 918 TaxID=1255637 RepID=A0A2H1IGT3_9MICO|nr:MULTISPECIES: hypothetical protein [Brevibacterium]SMX74384.1 hypothetical protein BANT918_00980 [Brevibacterium antiquum CNRZ 918]HCG54850.1 hypothetical protein [Brevibacterium sp.]